MRCMSYGCAVNACAIDLPSWVDLSSDSSGLVVREKSVFQDQLNIDCFIRVISIMHF